MCVGKRRVHRELHCTVSCRACTGDGVGGSLRMSSQHARVA